MTDLDPRTNTEDRIQPEGEAPGTNQEDWGSTEIGRRRAPRGGDPRKQRSVRMVDRRHARRPSRRHVSQIVHLQGSPLGCSEEKENGRGAKESGRGGGEEAGGGWFHQRNQVYYVAG